MLMTFDNDSYIQERGSTGKQGWLEISAVMKRDRKRNGLLVLQLRLGLGSLYYELYI